MSKDCVPSQCTEITAVYFRNTLILRAKGTKPTPCHKVVIKQLPIRIFPPEYGVETCAQPGICAQVIAPFDVTDAFLAPHTDSVRVHCHDGVRVVPVKQIRSEDNGTSLRLLEGNAGDGAVRREATGYSATFSFDEAFQDALNNLPPDPKPFPDKLVTIRVVESGALFGGIAGFHKMFLRIEAN